MLQDAVIRFRKKSFSSELKVHFFIICLVSNSRRTFLNSNRIVEFRTPGDALFYSNNIIEVRTPDALFFTIRTPFVISLD